MGTGINRQRPLDAEDPCNKVVMFHLFPIPNPTLMYSNTLTVYYSGDEGESNAIHGQ